ncbi:MAG TPA: DNA replication and repair protein RecF [Oceanipulchritudo sp.]|nr:DNA replication and repair protein RecF [Oceanipulchritudo sp.]
MRFRQVRAANFRNFTLLETTFPGGAQFIRGRNGHGKTNLLEALGLVTSLRSFRTSEVPALIRWESQPREAVLVFEIEHEQLGETTLELRLKPGSKQVLLDGNPVRKLGEILGLFPTITFSSQDIQILRGSPGLRRRMMDMMFVVMDPAYYTVLSRYHQALKSRNALLKQRAPSTQRRPFEDILIREGWALLEMRKSLLSVFLPHFKTAYAGISGVEEEPALVYEPSIEAAGLESYAEVLASQMRRDQESGTTNKGPHRDDLAIRLQAHAAREFASEGQQRGLVLALRMGLVDWYRQRGGTPPVILADDIVGELDATRRRGFWRMLGTQSQIIATGTVFPAEDDFHNWTHWRMENGSLNLEEETQPS